MTDYTRAINVEIVVAHGASGMPYLSFSMELAEPSDCPEEEAIARRMVDGEAHVDFTEDDEGIEIDFNYVWDIAGEGEEQKLTKVFDSLSPAKQQVPLTMAELETVYAEIEYRVNDFAWEFQKAWDDVEADERAEDRDYWNRHG